MKLPYLLLLLSLLISCDPISTEEQTISELSDTPENTVATTIPEEEKEEIQIVTEATLPNTRVIDPNLIGTWVGDEVTYTLEKDGNAKEVLDQNGSVVLHTWYIQDNQFCLFTVAGPDEENCCDFALINPTTLELNFFGSKSTFTKK